jgi:hypothetical protein
MSRADPTVERNHMPTSTINPIAPTGPVPPPLRGDVEQTAAARQAWAEGHARLVIGIAIRMSWGESAADVTRELAREVWRYSEAEPGSYPEADRTFRWLRELGETPNNFDGVAQLLRLADLIRLQQL